MKSPKKKHTDTHSESLTNFNIPVINQLPQELLDTSPSERFIGDFMVNTPAGENSGFILNMENNYFAEKNIYEGDFVVASTQEPIAAGDLVVASLDNKVFLATYFPLGNKIRLEKDSAGKNQLVVEHQTPDFSLKGKVIQIIRSI